MFILNKKFLVGILSIFLLLILILPALSYAQDTGLVPCGTQDSSGKITKMCDFSDAIKLINNIIDWFIGISLSIFTVTLIYGGFQWMTSGENPGKREDAKKILWNTVIGFIFILAAWLIVYTILTVIAPDSKDALRFISK